MSGVACAVAAGAVVGSLISADASRKAANQQADSIAQAQIISQSAADKAREDVLTTITPALAEYSRAMSAVEKTIADGTVDVLGMLGKTSDDVQSILTNSGADAKKAILGSSASATGISRDTFDTRYSQIANLPVEQQAQAYSQMAESIASRSQATGTPTSVSPDASGQVAGATSVTESTPGYGLTEADRLLEQGQITGLAQLASTTATARQDVTTGRDTALEAIRTGRTEALDRLQPYSEVGKQALQQEAALSGALGPEAQQAAIDAFIESPGQAYLREQQEQALIRNQAAIGGLGGGRIRSALMEQAMGIASTQQQQSLENLRNIAIRGQEADTTAAGIWTGTTGTEATISTNAATQLATLAQALGVAGTDLTTATAQQRSDLAMSAGLSLAQLDQLIGAAKAGALSDIGKTMAATKAGSIADIAAVQQTSAANQMNVQQNLATILANLGVGAGSAQSNLEVAKGSALAAGTMLQGEAWKSAIENIATAAAGAASKE